MVAGLGRFLTSPSEGGSQTPLAAVPRRALVAAVGLGCGISPAFYGYFELGVWGILAIGFLALALVLVLAGGRLPGGLAGLAVVALFAFAAWCLISTGWAESADRALSEGDRWILYGTFLLVLVLLLGERRDAEVFLGAAVAGVLGVAAYDVLGLLAGHRTLFSGTRLLEPLGYVNGLGGYFLLGFWPLIAVAERCRRPPLAGAAAGAATVLACLVVLTDSRGTLFAFAASAVLVLLLVPGRNRRAWALLAVLAGVAMAWIALTDVTQALPSPIANPPSSTIQHGARWALLSGVAVGFVWALATWAVELAAGASEARLRLRRLSALTLIVVAAVGVAAAAAAVGDPAGKISEQYRSFTEQQPTVNGASRFTSGGGNRYDYWRIAWQQFTSHPLDGVGAGNFDRTYYLERRSDEDVRQAHSIELQTLGDTGLIGAVLLGMFFVAVAAGAWRSIAAVRAGRLEAGLVVAAAGTFAVWLAQTSVDWLHLIPGLTGIALGAAAILLRGPGLGAREGAGQLRLPLLGAAGIAVLAVAAIVVVGRPTAAAHLRSSAEADLPTSPVGALEAAEESLSLNPESVQGYYLKGAALARLGAYIPAREALHEAIAREPHNYVSWALLGDLLTRRGRIGAAMRAYGTASRLNPRDPGLRLLGRDRAVLARLHRHPGQAGAVEEAALARRPVHY